MTGGSTFRLVELFRSIQGEGANAGMQASFVRLGGCNARSLHLDCAEWCDTKGSWDGSRSSTGTLVETVERQLRAWRTPLIVFTGGEPLLQSSAIQSWLDTTSLLGPRTRKSSLVAVETNGTLPRTLFDRYDIPIWWTVSPKPPLYQIVDGPINELKIVVDQDDLFHPRLHQILETAPPMIPLYLQPKDNDFETARQILALTSSKYSRWRLGLQIHKLLEVE